MVFMLFMVVGGLATFATYEHHKEKENKNERDVIESKEKLMGLMSIKIQLDEQEAFAKDNKKVHEIIQQFRAF